MFREAKHADDSSDLLTAVREAVTGALNEGANPTQLAAILVYVATEMSLQLSDSTARALPVLLEPMAVAARNYIERVHSKDKKINTALLEHPKGWVH